MRTLLLVGVGRMGRPYIAAARRLGVRVHAVEAAANAEKVGGLVDELTVCRGGADELWAQAAHAAVAARRPDGVVGFSEPQVLAAALVQDELGLPGPSLRAAVLSRNKALQRARFAAAGIGQPDYLVTDSLDDDGARDWAAQRLPVVVKPLSSAGSDGVELVADAAAFEQAAWRRAEEGRLLVERAVSGPEFSWEALVQDGKIWLANLTAKETTGPPNFVEVAHRLPAGLDAQARAAADDLGAAVVDALGMRTGLVHLEFRASPAGPRVMEVAVRTPGDFLMDLLGLAYGVDWFELVVRAALGHELPPPPDGPLRYTASYLPVAPAGTVTAVRGLADVLAHPAVVDAGIAVSPGDTVAPARSSIDRVGQVVLAADDRDGRDAALAEVRDRLVVDVRPAAP
jgi:biotin carboxylase